jgi:hypothetical protein
MKTDQYTVLEKFQNTIGLFVLHPSTFNRNNNDDYSYSYNYS